MDSHGGKAPISPLWGRKIEQEESLCGGQRMGGVFALWQADWQRRVQNRLTAHSQHSGIAPRAELAGFAAPFIRV